MTIIATDILTDLCGLSLGLLIALIPIGLMLWLFGWLSHRFWIVLATTVLAGVFGLLEATTWHAQPIVAAVLLAIAAGVLALALVRVITFSVGGLAGVYIVQLAFPTWQQHVICFLVSGLLCLLLFRWFFMVITSLLGAAVLSYGTLAILHFYEILDTITWSESNAMLLTIMCGAATLFGFLFQFYHDRRRARRLREEDGESDEGGIASMILGKIGFGRSSGRHAA